jgi:soluble lytic murein transglycosylase-like protein
MAKNVKSAGRTKIIIIGVLGSMIFTGLPLYSTPSKAEALPSRRCPKYESLLAQNNLPVATFSRIMFRESNCNPLVRSKTSDTGLLQINDVNHEYLSKKLGVKVTIQWLKNAANNIRAAAVLYKWGGLRPWRTTK